MKTHASSYWHSTMDSIHRIDPYFGRCVTDYCQNHRPEPALLKWIAQKLHGANPAGNFKLGTIKTIVNNLQSNHEYYRQQALPRIGQSFLKAQEHHQNSLHFSLGYKLFNLFATALIQHINEEERVFESLLHQFGTHSEAHQHFGEDHHNESDSLDQIINLLQSEINRQRFDPGSILLTQLRNLSNDLKIHTFVEEQLLAPILNEKYGVGR